MPAHDPEALTEMGDGYKEEMIDAIHLSMLECHINDRRFSDGTSKEEVTMR